MTIEPLPPPSEQQREFWRSQALVSASRDVEALPIRYRSAVVDDDRVIAWVKRLIEIATEGPETWMEPVIDSGPSLLLVGDVGRGKTYQAVGAARALLTSGLRCHAVVTTAADLYAQMRPRAGSDSESEFRRVASAGVLVLDDIGAAKGSEWVEEINYRLINHRYEHQRPTIITTNLTPPKIPAALGARVASRIGEMATTVQLLGTDRRRGAR